MESHLGRMIGKMPRPIVGEVQGVHHGTTEANPFILYDVVLWPQTEGYSGALQVVNVPYLGQQAGGAIEQSVPLLVGQKVAVDFEEDDYNRPYIKGMWMDRETQLPADESTYPKAAWIINGLRFEVDKDGGLEIFDHPNDAKLVRLVKVAGNYQVHLGGNTSLQEVVLASFISSFKLAISAAAVIPGDGGLEFKTKLALAMDAAFIDAHTSDVTLVK